MYLFTGELLDVDTGTGENPFKVLVFEGSRYDFGLKKNVPVSISLGIGKELEHFIPNYKKHIGEKILLGVETRMNKKKTGVFSWVQTDILDVSQLLTTE